MDRKIVGLLFLLLPFTCFAQKKTIAYIKKNERDLKKFAFSQYLGHQVASVDTSYMRGAIDPFATEFFNNSKYRYEALLQIIEFSKLTAKRQIRSAGKGKCYCFETSLDFYTSSELDSVVRSLRKYLQIE